MRRCVIVVIVARNRLFEPILVPHTRAGSQYYPLYTLQYQLSGTFMGRLRRWAVVLSCVCVFVCLCCVYAEYAAASIANIARTNSIVECPFKDTQQARHKHRQPHMQPALRACELRSARNDHRDLRGCGALRRRRRRIVFINGHVIYLWQSRCRRRVCVCVILRARTIVSTFPVFCDFPGLHYMF